MGRNPQPAVPLMRGANRHKVAKVSGSPSSLLSPREDVVAKRKTGGDAPAARLRARSRSRPRAVGKLSFITHNHLRLSLHSSSLVRSTRR
jgi:hypothetical protein